MSRLRREKATAGGPKAQPLVALCAAGLALFNFPLLAVWDSGGTVFGLPVLPVALFAIWAGLIAALALASGMPRDDGRLPHTRRTGQPRDDADAGEA